jgi:hypothetical protein
VCELPTEPQDRTLANFNIKNRNIYEYDNIPLFGRKAGILATSVEIDYSEGLLENASCETKSKLG